MKSLIEIKKDISHARMSVCISMYPANDINVYDELKKVNIALSKSEDDIQKLLNFLNSGGENS